MEIFNIFFSSERLVLGQEGPIWFQVVNVGMDAIMRCNKDIFLLEEVLQFLNISGRTNLSRISNPLSTTMWKKGWLIDD